MVVSHERSGTHFLMNTLAAAFGYVSNPWIDFDHEQVNINYYATNEVVELFTKLGERRLANTVKLHHQVGFFDDCLATITELFTVFYIYRDPRDVMKSYHRVVDRLAGAEGPKTASCGAFIRAAPEGHMMRYQTHQHANLLKRWQAHVEGWLAAGERHAGIVPIRFEDLDRDYQRTVDALGQALDLAPRTHDRPSREKTSSRRPTHPTRALKSRHSTPTISRSSSTRSARR